MISKRAKRLVAPREKFLVLEVAPQGANALFLSVDDDRNLIFEKFVKNAELKKFLSSPLRRITQKSWEGKHFFKSRRRIIVSANSSVATTMAMPIDLVRDTREGDTTEDEITLLELENLIAQAMAKVFTQCRNEAATRLGVDDIHAILVGARAEKFKIDGRVVMNPVGFTGKKVSLVLELVFTRRDVFENFKPFFNSPDEFFFVESPQAWLLSATRTAGLPRSVVIDDGNGDEAQLFVFEKTDREYPALRREKLAWSFAQVFDLIAKSFGVTPIIAKDLYLRYRAGELSPSAAAHFRKTIKPAVDMLLAETVRAEARGPIYFDSEYPAPFDLPHAYKGAKFADLPVAEILSDLDLSLDGAVPLGTFRTLAPFLEAYFAKSASEINQKLRRRLHWLV
jgi:hypothetical protein